MLPNCDPAYDSAAIGLRLLYVTIGETPRKAPCRQLTVARVMSLVIRFPSRWMVNGTAVPAGYDLMALPIWFQLCTRVPATATILSPDRSPARSAGDRGSPWAHTACA